MGRCCTLSVVVQMFVLWLGRMSPHIISVWIFCLTSVLFLCSSTRGAALETRVVCVLKPHTHVCR